MTKAELLYGAQKSRRKKENFERITEFLLPFRIKGFNDAETYTYVSVRKELEENGTPIGPNDTLIAAIVLADSGTLVTDNERAFSRVNGLIIEDWTE